MRKILLIIAFLISGMGLFAQNIGDNTIIDYEGYSLKFTVTCVNPNEYLEYAFPYIFTKDLQGITEEDIDFFRTDIGGVLTLIQNLKFGDTNWDYYSDSKNATDKSIFCYLDVYQDGNFLINLKENEDPDYDITTMKISGNKLYIQDMNGDYTICLEKVK